MTYKSDLSNNFSYGVRLSELLYEKNPQLGTSQTINPASGALIGLPRNIEPRRAHFVNTAAKSRRSYLVLDVAADIWTGQASSISVPATDPEDSDYDIQVLAFQVSGFRGESVRALLAGQDTGQTQGDSDSQS